MQLKRSMISAAVALVAALAGTSCGSDAKSGPASSAAPTSSSFEDGSDCPKPDGTSGKIVHFATAPPTCIDPSRTYTATVTTNLGVITIALDPVAAPIAVNSFVFLAGYHYFDATVCHRVVNAFVIQCGDPSGTGTGGPGYEFADELPAAGSYKIGSLAMANSGPNTNGSQFFIISGPQGVALKPNYTLFGQVSGGLDVVSAIDALGSDGDGAPMSPVEIASITVTAG